MTPAVVAQPSPAFIRGYTDAQQDACENIPFASVGYRAMAAPNYVAEGDRDDYLAGYFEAAMDIFHVPDAATYYGDRRTPGDVS